MTINRRRNTEGGTQWRNVMNHAPTLFGIFRRVVNAKFHGFCPSESSDERKMRKMTFPPRQKCGNRQNLRFVHGRNAENGKINVSAMAEIQKTAKSTFRPRAKCKKRQNLRFAHGRNAEIGKNCVSPTGEMQKTAKSTFRPRTKCKKTAKSTFRPRTKCKKQQNLRFRRGKYRHGK